MLRLKQIDLVGFKSFCTREHLKFAGNGLAAVVGPNGCGKSNICDAVNWVLGEQSAKSLRGGRMHDVIFAGTRHRKPAGMAKVTLTLHDPDDTLERLFSKNGRSGAPKVPPSPTPGEIAVTRKLFSNGTSQYILNGKTVRLRDVQDLFLGTGLGPNHYAIIEQGRIGQLLTARSLDRRAFVEEAAGVTRFKSRRKLAELKLANTELNLERVHDILQEVARQANSLKRQAERAERYETYREQLREALSLVFAGQFRRLESSRATLEAETTLAKQRLASVSDETRELESEFSGKRGREQEWEAQLEVERAELSDLRIDEERMRERIQQQTRTISDNAARQQRAVEDLETASSRVDALEAGAHRERYEVTELEGAASAIRDKLESKEVECSAQQSSLADTHAEQEACRVRMLDSLNALSDTKGRLGKLDETLAGCAARLERARSSNADAESGIASATTRREALLAQAAKMTDAVGALRARRDALREAVEQGTASLGSLRKAAEGQRAERSALAARRDSVHEMLQHRAYGAEAVKDIFDALEREPAEGFAPLGVLADFLEVDAGYERVAEQFLAEELEHVVVGNWSEAARGAQLVRDEFGGRAAFLLVQREADGEPQAPPALKSAVRLTDHVRLVARGGAVVPALLPKLRDAFLVEDAATAERLAGLHPDLYFVLADGTWYRGPVVQAGRKSSSGPLVLKQQLRELAPALQRAEQALAQAEQDIESAEDAVRRDRGELETVMASLQDTEKEALAVQHEVSRSESVVADLQQQAQQAAADIDRLDAERSSAESDRERALDDRTRLEGEYADARARSADLAEQAQARQAVLASLQEERTTLRTEAAAMDERLRSGINSVRRAEAALADQRDRAKDLQDQIQRWTDESRELTESNRTLDKQVVGAGERRAALQAQISETSDRLKESRARTGALMEAIRDQRADVEAARERCSAKEVALARLQSDIEHLESNCAAELDQPIAEIADTAPETLSEEEVRQAEERHRSIRDKIDRLGPVNVLARREYEDVSERKLFLETQQQDLLDSIRNTREAIREIDTASRERFEAAFEAINHNFRRVFATLFGGGIGELRLSDPADADGSGIEIVAQPPGKRLQNIALLSGGEKSLTVMALLLATFRYQPSPFCVLDEVDSQLDEANTIRLRGLIQEMAPETQFIVITHSKTMMEAAEALYGVTMGEAGVSKLVSVRMAGSRIAEMPQGAGAQEREAVVA